MDDTFDELIALFRFQKKTHSLFSELNNSSNVFWTEKDTPFQWFTFGNFINLL